LKKIELLAIVVKLLTPLFRFTSCRNLQQLFTLKKLLSDETIYCCCLVHSFVATNISAQSIDSTLAIYANQFGQERTYLHYDKATYAPGENDLVQGISYEWHF
jgi:hypothetical protein